MNFIGKIFVWLILIASIVFMTLAAAVYATHRNLEAALKQTESQLTEAKTRYDQLDTEFKRSTTSLEQRVEEQEQQVRKLETERVALETRNNAIQAEVDQLKETRREAVAAVAATEQNNARITQENEGLREDIRNNESAADEAFRKALAAVEELNQLQGQIENVGERNADLTQQNAQMTSVMRENGLDPSTPADAVKPRVDGFVSAVRRKGALQLVEISIGADDGLKKGHTVEVFRQTSTSAKYLGRIEILKTAPDRAVGRVDTKFQEGRIQEGDRVATRLKLS